MSKSKYFTHSHALVDDGAQIGEGTRIWAFAHVLKGAVIGEHCNIGDYAMVETGAKLGNHCTVKNGVQIWEGIVAEDGVFFGPNCTLTNDMFPRSLIKPPKETWLKKTFFKHGCTIGANATIVCGVTIGRFAYVAAGAVVTKDVADYAMVLGTPARFHSWICECAIKLEFKGERTACPKCDAKYVKDGKAIKRA